MNIDTDSYYNSWIMVKVIVGDAVIETDVTNMKGLVPNELIEQFEQVVDDLKDYNLNKIKTLEK